MATWLSCLLCSGFQAPHHVLTSFVAGMTGYMPLDAGNFKENISGQELDPPRGFDFTKLQQGARQIYLFQHPLIRPMHQTWSRSAKLLDAYSITYSMGTHEISPVQKMLSWSNTGSLNLAVSRTL